MLGSVFRLALIIAVAGALAACTSASSRQKTGAGFSAIPGASPGVSLTAAQDYRIAADDVLEVSVFQVEDLRRTVPVSQNGLINLPLIGNVQAAGLTTGELERSVAARLSESYLQSPQVSVLVKEFKSQRITVDGAVKKPGIFPTSGQVSLVQSIALAEGLTEIADPGGIIVFRTINNQRQAAKFDLAAIRKGKSEDPMLKAGDIVMVDQSAGRSALRDIRGVLPVASVFTPF